VVKDMVSWWEVIRLFWTSVRVECLTYGGQIYQESGVDSVIDKFVESWLHGQAIIRSSNMSGRNNQSCGR
jgi:hypothetical protein